MKASSKVYICVVTYFAAVVCHMANGMDLNWIKDCPKTCNCQVSHFDDLSISKSLNEIERKFQRDSSNTVDNNEAAIQKNSVLYDKKQADILMEAAHPEQSFFNTAICVLQEGVTIDDFFTGLPLEIQVLNVLQGPERVPISIETTHLTKFNDLQVFEIFGFHDENSLQEENKTKLLFKADFPDLVPGLRYLHLENVRLRENLELSNHINVNEVDDANFYSRNDHDANEILEANLLEKKWSFKSGIDPQNSGHWVRDDNSIPSEDESEMKPRNKRAIQTTHSAAKLVFVEPPNEIIPYEVYIKMQEKKKYTVFSGLKNLKYLQITDSNLREIDWEWFDDLKSLEILSLANNQIEYIPDFTFHALKNLRILVLTNNNIQSLISTSFAGLLSLETLDLSKNNLMELSDMSFPPFPKLKTIDLSDNPLKFVRGNTFEVMNNTQNLYLGSKNENIKIQTNAFTGLGMLQSLEISGIQLHLLERDFFRGMSDLKYLQLQGRIDYLAYDAFGEILLTKEIILRNCSILALSMDTFYGLYNLEKIDLSYNNLKKLPPKLFEQQTLLKEIVLTGNQLTDIPANLFSGLSPKLIHLQDNPWLCTCKMKIWAILPINQVRQKKDRSCKYYADKSFRCSSDDNQEIEYVYSRSVEPRCSAPSEFKGWTVSKVLRKGRICIDSLNDKQRRLYKKQKYEMYLQKSENKTNHALYEKTGVHNDVKGVIERKLKTF
ncbi:unnamed protein product [Bemisia tabaci]|uniref:Uncharacterized protein n=1 Tax=Bemisia tabaci TaxID=7038 RepID=A0A9P0EXJ1_BEMTA|nr:unnamed protein product [Bemisia tabaci]